MNLPTPHVCCRNNPVLQQYVAKEAYTACVNAIRELVLALGDDELYLVIEESGIGNCVKHSSNDMCCVDDF